MVDTPLVDPALRHELLRGLADPSRLRILQALTYGERRVSDVVVETGLSQPNVSKHLRCLLGCGLVEREPRGREAFYRPVDGLEDALAAIDRLLERVGERVASCELTEDALAGDGR